MDLKEAERFNHEEQRKKKEHLPAYLYRFGDKKLGSIRVKNREHETMRRALAKLMNFKLKDVEFHETCQSFTWTPHMDAYNFSIHDEVPDKNFEKKYPLKDL